MGSILRGIPHFNIILELDKFIERKVTKKHMRKYGEKFVMQVKSSTNYYFFKKAHKEYDRCSYETYADIKRAYFKWTNEEDPNVSFIINS